MKQDRCKKTNCPHWLPLEQSGIGGAVPVFSRRCAITNRNVIRMKECPLDPKSTHNTTIGE